MSDIILARVDKNLSIDKKIVYSIRWSVNLFF